MFVFDPNACFYFDIIPANAIAEKEAPICIDFLQSYNDDSNNGSLPFSILGVDGQLRTPIRKKRKATYQQQNEVDYLHVAAQSSTKRRVVCKTIAAGENNSTSSSTSTGAASASSLSGLRKEGAHEEAEELSTFFSVCFDSMFSKN